MPIMYEDAIKQLPKLRFRKSLDEADIRAVLQQAIHGWIKEDLGVAAKMTIMPEHVDKLIDRLTVEAI